MDIIYENDRFFFSSFFRYCKYVVGQLWHSSIRNFLMKSKKNQAHEELCKVGKNIIFQNKTLLVMFYRHDKTLWYQFQFFQHVLLAENSEDGLASSCVEFSIGLSCNPVWDWVTIGTIEFSIGLSLVPMVTALLLSTVPGHHIGPPCIRTNQKFRHKCSVFECIKMAQNYAQVSLPLAHIIQYSKMLFFCWKALFIRKIKIKMADRKKHVLSKVVKNIIFITKHY